MMRLRNKLEELGKMKGVNQDEKGIFCSSPGSLSSALVQGSESGGSILMIYVCSHTCWNLGIRNLGI